MQLDLLAGLPPAPAEHSLAAAIARARAFVDRHRRVCRDCGEDRQEIVFLHGRRQSAWSGFIARLVQQGASNRRLAMEIADCVTVCRRCQLRRVNPNISRASKTSTVGVVAKAGSTTGSGESAARGRVAKGRAIVRDSERVA